VVNLKTRSLNRILFVGYVQSFFVESIYCPSPPKSMYYENVLLFPTYPPPPSPSSPLSSIVRFFTPFPPHAGKHCEYQSFENTHFAPLTHAVPPVHPEPPHWPYSGTLPPPPPLADVVVTAGALDVVVGFGFGFVFPAVVVTGRRVVVGEVPPEELGEWR
jgi:hypothetical protein